MLVGRALGKNTLRNGMQKLEQEFLFGTVSFPLLMQSVELSKVSSTRGKAKFTPEPSASLSAAVLLIPLQAAGALGSHRSSHDAAFCESLSSFSQHSY